jgi:PAS domain S-box-containing protein
MTAPSIARLGQFLCLGGAALGALGLFGWLSGTRVGTSIVPGLPLMTANTALMHMLLGAAGAARYFEAASRYRGLAGRFQRGLALLATFAVLALAGATLFEYGLAIDLHIDRLLISSQPVTPVRPSPPTALALALLATALLLFDTRSTSRVHPSEWLVLCAALTAFTGLIGIILGAEPLYRLTRAPVIGLSLPTAISVLLTSTGLLLERPSAGLMRVATSPGPGGVLLRRLAPLIVVVPVALGFVVTRIPHVQAVEYVSIPIAIMAATLTAGGLLVLVVTAMPLDRAHAQLVASRAETRSLVEQAPDGIFVADLDGHYTDVNDAGCRIVGAAREEIIGKTIVDLIPPEDVSRLWQARDLLLGGATQVAEWRLRRKDGSYVPVEVSARILPDGRWQGFVRDISERRRLEAQLRLSEAKSTGIISISSDAIISIDAGQRITMFNEGAEKIFGYSRAEATGAPLDILIPERLHAAHRQHVASFASNPEAARRMGRRDLAIVGRRRNGEEFPADAAISTFNVSGTRVLTVVLRDVTEQKRIEHEQTFLAAIGSTLADTLDYRETLSRIAAIPVGGLSDFCAIDLVDDAGEIRRVQVASRDASHGRISDLLLRLPLDSAHGCLVRAALVSRQPALLQHVAAGDIDVADNEDDRRALDVLEGHSVMVVPLVAHGKVLGAMSFVSVIPSRAFDSDDVRVASQVAERAALAIENARLYDAARHAIQVRDEVVGIVAHELRNPLAAILIEVELILRRGLALDSEARESAQAIKVSGTRMNGLIQDLLDVTRLEAGRLVIERRRLSATHVATDACELSRALASSRGLELRLTLPDVLPDVWADRDRLLQVLDNLIGNAVKFTKAGGTITVGAASRHDAVLFWVADSGPGISSDHQAHLFDRFWQARGGGRSGAGLGLPIVKGIVDAHGGRVWVESAPGRGSTFFFTIPTAEDVSHSSGDPTRRPTMLET